MSDPIEAALRLAMGGATWYTVGLICLIVAACHKDFLDRSRRERERRTLHACRVMTRRILTFLPTYEKEVRDYAEWIRSQPSLEPLVRLSGDLRAESKVDAEKMFCMQDSGRLEAIALLQMETNQLLRKQQEE